MTSIENRDGAIIVTTCDGVELVDDSVGKLFSRTVARLNAKGVGIDYIFVDEWHIPSSGDVTGSRTWTIDVCDEKGERAGEIQVVETRRREVSGYRFTAPVNRSVNEVTRARVVLVERSVHELLGVDYEAHYGN